MVIDILIAGGGIAGLTASLTAARLGRSPMVLTGDMLGGQLISINSIEGYPGFPDGIAGYDLCPIVQEQADAVGARFASDKLASLRLEKGLWQISTEGGDALSARCVILAMGARLRDLDVPGFTRLQGKGVSHCASCDGPMLRGKHAAVIGGGDSALQEALTLAESGARVTLLHRGPAFSAQHNFVQRVERHTAITCRMASEVAEILGEHEVAAIRVGDGEVIEVAAVFAYVGLAPNTGMLAGLLPLDPGGAVATDQGWCTSLPGLYAAGALRSGWGGRAVLSAAEGAAAALAAHGFLCAGNGD